MPEIKEVSEQMRGCTIRAAQVGSDEWGYITTKGENGKLYVRAFDTLDEAQEFIDAFMPDDGELKLTWSRLRSSATTE